MKLLKNIILLLFNKYVRRKSNGYCLKVFSTNMGMAYIKLCQMLALQNIGDLFTEADRLDVLSICYDVNPIPYREIKQILKQEYGSRLYMNFKHVHMKPVGSASVSQVHRCKLNTGEDVVLKIKRQDVMSGIQRDINTLHFLCSKFGWLVGVTNHATSVAWDYYLKWLEEETDFNHEIENIKTLQRFAARVNGKVPGTKKLIVPKVYNGYCTDNVICMEYIPHKTINQVDDPETITAALNSYVRQSFYALFNGIPVVYHGDMHPGNLFVDEEGNLGFLDMGLVFEIGEKDAALTRKLFTSEWLKDVDAIAKILRPWFKGTDSQYRDFKGRVNDVVNSLPDKCVTAYFMDILFLCMDVDLEPPYYLFCMAKAFICLFGADAVYMNDVTCKEMLDDLVLKYLVDCAKQEGLETIESCCNTLLSAITLDKYGVYGGLANCMHKFSKVTDHLRKIAKDELA